MVAKYHEPPKGLPSISLTVFVSKWVRKPCPSNTPEVTLQWDNIISHHGISPFFVVNETVSQPPISPSRNRKIQTKKPTKPQQKQNPSEKKYKNHLPNLLFC